MNKIEAILRENGYAIAPEADREYVNNLLTSWEEDAEKRGGVSDADVDIYINILKTMSIVIPAPVQKSKQIMTPDFFTDFPAQEETELNYRVFMIFDRKDKSSLPHHVYGAFTNPQRGLAFEYADDEQIEKIEIAAADRRFEDLFNALGRKHVYIRLSGNTVGNEFQVYRIKAETPPENDSDDENVNAIPYSEIDNNLLQFTIEHLRTSIIQPTDDDAPIDMPFQTMEDIVMFMDCAGNSLPENIRAWAKRNILAYGQQSSDADEKRHAKKALSMMLNVSFGSKNFAAIDPDNARKILDEELYGLDNVKQRVIETIIQVNRTHTLPAYGILLAGPAGTGKSRIAYAVAKILKIPFAVLDMSTVRDPEALTGTSRIYTNAHPGRIMEAFYETGSSNIVFIINELDKSDHEGQHGNPADTLLTLLDNLGFTDNYMECQIPTNGVYTIATANELDKISKPLLSRFAVINIPDYTPDEKKIIFKDYSLPKILRHMDMKPEECIVTDSAVDKIIEMYRNFSGCRDLEQAAEHIAGNALFRIETTGSGSVTYDTDDVTKLLG